MKRTIPGLALALASVLACAAEDLILLIRNFANGAAGAWFAAGIPRND